MVDGREDWKDLLVASGREIAIFTGGWWKGRLEGFTGGWWEGRGNLLVVDGRGNREGIERTTLSKSLDLGRKGARAPSAPSNPENLLRSI